jgi:hypothetical protein
MSRFWRNPTLIMIQKRKFLASTKLMSVALGLVFALTYCSEDYVISEEIIDDPATHAAAVVDCSTCTYVVPPNTHVVDGKALNLKPGSVIGLNASYGYKNLVFRNLEGTASAPIIIKNCGGTVEINATGLSFALKTENSKYFTITGGNVSKSYGIKVNGGNLGIALDKLSTNFAVDHIEIYNSGFAGVMAKTDPTCDDATNRGFFIMRDISLNNNYVHDTGGEGFYVGNSFYQSGRQLSCGVKYPHEIHNVKIFDNVVRNTGWEGIQLGCATKGAAVYNNTVENYGKENRAGQNNGVQIGEGSGGLFYNNFIKDGPGNGLIMLGLGDNLIHDNVITNAGGSGIFCDERYTPGTGFKFLNNTIVNPKYDGIRIYAELVPMNVIINNIIVNPGSYSTYSYPRTNNDAYIYKLNSKVKIQLSNNYFTRDITSVKFTNAGAYNYRLTSGSPVVDKGISIASYNIAKDFYKQARLKGSAYDIGASEY